MSVTSMNSDFKSFLPVDNAYDACILGLAKSEDSNPSYGYVPSDPFRSNTREDPPSNLAELVGKGNLCGFRGCESTGWTFVWQFNAVIMLAIGANFLLMALGACFYKARLVGTVINCFLAFLSIGGGILALTSFFEWGYFCTTNDHTVS